MSRFISTDAPDDVSAITNAFYANNGVPIKQEEDQYPIMPNEVTVANSNDRVKHEQELDENPKQGLKNDPGPALDDSLTKGRALLDSSIGTFSVLSNCEYLKIPHGYGEAFEEGVLYGGIHRSPMEKVLDLNPKNIKRWWKHLTDASISNGSSYRLFDTHELETDPAAMRAFYPTRANVERGVAVMFYCCDAQKKWYVQQRKVGKPVRCTKWECQVCNVIEM